MLSSTNMYYIAANPTTLEDPLQYQEDLEALLQVSFSLSGSRLLLADFD